MSSPREEDQALYDSGLLFTRISTVRGKRNVDTHDSKGSQRDIFRGSKWLTLLRIKER